jgi:hypothetical protein
MLYSARKAFIGWELDWQRKKLEKVRRESGKIAHRESKVLRSVF